MSVQIRKSKNIRGTQLLQNAADQTECDYSLRFLKFAAWLPLIVNSFTLGNSFVAFSRHWPVV